MKSWAAGVLMLSIILVAGIQFCVCAQDVTSNRSANKTCGSCHAEIAKSYAVTAMATASGPASERFSDG